MGTSVAGLLLDTRRTVDRPGSRQPRWCTEPHHQGDGRRPHRGQISQTGGGCFGTNLLGRRPVEAEVPALDQDVDGDGSPARIDGQDRGVVSGPNDDPRVLQVGQVRSDPVDQPELANSTEVRLRLLVQR